MRGATLCPVGSPPGRRRQDSARCSMTIFEFLLTIEVNGAAARRAFCIAADTLPAAVARSLDQLVQEQPAARFKALTYYASRLENRPFG
jgi:hypothetical protein